LIRLGLKLTISAGAGADMGGVGDCGLEVGFGGGFLLTSQENLYRFWIIKRAAIL